MDSPKPRKKMTPRMEKRMKWRQEHNNNPRLTRARTTSNDESTSEKSSQKEQAPIVSERGFTTKQSIPQFNKNKSEKQSSKHTNMKSSNKKDISKNDKKSKYGNKEKVNGANNSSVPSKDKSPHSTPKKGKVEPVDSVEKLESSTSIHTPKRYVLFVGNLPKDITKEQIEEHFKKTGGVKAVRLPKEKVTDKPKRFAYVEFNSTISHRIALRLHNTTLAGRKINVEFTSSGKGSKERMDKLKEKNDRLAKFKMPFDT